MGKVFKKTSNKRPAEAVVEKKESPHKKKSKKEEVIDEQIDDEEIDDEEIDDEEIDDEEIDDEEINDEEIDEEEVDDEEEEDDVNDDDKQDETNTILDFNFEGFPMEKDDLEGIVNMLTQTFLRTDIDLKGMAEDMISKSPFGSVVGPADDDADEDNTNMVYGLCSAVSVNRKENPKFVKDILNYLHYKVKKYATKEVAGKLESIFKENDESTAFFVNERMLNFPEIIVPQLFESLRSDIAGLAKPYKNIIYIQKIRILEENEKDKKPTDNNGASSSFKPKKKMGKAEKKRLAAAALSKAEVKFDNPEDKLLFELKEGSEIHFDYPVHMDVEPGSKFHVIEESGKKLNPFRRLVIMDFTRFDAFLKSRGKNVIV